MDRTERFYKIDSLLCSRQQVPVDAFLKALGISLATFKRDLEYMRDRFNAPIVWDRDLNGYRYDQQPGSGPAFNLPGMWFNETEVHALLMMQQLLENIQPGLLHEHIAPLQARLNALLDKGDHSANEVEKRFRIVHAARRTLPLAYFEAVASATLKQKKLRIAHFNRQSGETISRTISPQQIVFYRDNWYVDAWCHLRNDLRSFAIDAIQSADMLDESARRVGQDKLKAHFASGYGIFGGTATYWAKLKFTPERARWVSHEIWHPEQHTSFDGQGYYLLEIPYSDTRELLMDILKHGSEVEVLAPESLRQQVVATLQASLARYGK